MARGCTVTAPGVDGELLARFGRLTREVFEARWIHSLLVGARAQDAQFDHDRRGAEQLLRQRGWLLEEVTAYVEEIQQGARVVPRPPRESGGAKPARRKSKLAGLFGGGGQADGWAQAVRDWKFLERRWSAPAVATDEQRAERVQDALDAIHGRVRRARPQNVMAGLRVEHLFGEPRVPAPERALEDPADAELDPWEA